MSRIEPAWNRFFHADASTFGLGVFRLLFALCLAWEVQNSWHSNVFAIHGGYHLPYVSWLPSVSAATYRLLHVLQFPLIALFGLGITTRLSGSLLLLIQGYVFFSDQLNFRNHPYFFLLVLFLMILAPSGDALSLSRGFRARRAGRSFGAALLGGMQPRTFTQLIRIQVSIVYVYAGLHKLSPAFLSGRVLQVSVTGTLEGNVERLLGWALSPAALASVLSTMTHPAAFQLLALASVALELTLPLALWWPPMRKAGVIVGTLFHLGIALSMSIFGFSFAMIGSYVLFLDPAALRRRAQRLFTRL